MFGILEAPVTMLRYPIRAGLSKPVTLEIAITDIQAIMDKAPGSHVKRVSRVLCP